MYPRIVFHPERYLHNIKHLRKRFDEHGLTLMAVTKVFCADPKIVKYLDDYVDYLADSRIENLIKIKDMKKPKVLIRIPMHSEIADVIKYADISFNSELSTIKLLNDEAKKQGKIHKIVLMRDLGDLREGYFSDEDLYENAAEIAKLPNIKICGVAVNLTCYGAIIPTAEILEKLVVTAKGLEDRFGLKLEIVSGGNSSSLHLLDKNVLPKGITNLRPGECFVKGNEAAYGQDYPNMEQDVFTLETQIIELKEKPSMPIGESGLDAFGNKPVFEDKGIRKRAIVAIGQQDIYVDKIMPLNKDIQIFGASSDHLILDVTDCKPALKVGDIIEFSMTYPSILKTTTSEYVKKAYK